jgi:hypothetical protein
MTESYNEILGLDRNANAEQIYIAYRKKAKLLHPDINKSSDAHEKFIQLHEAYECLLYINTGKYFNENLKRYQTTKTHRTKTATERDYERRDQSRARAKYYAGVSYAEFEQSDFTKMVDGLDILNYIFNFLMLSIPFVILIITGFSRTGMILSFIAAIISVLFAFDYLAEFIASSKEIYRRSVSLFKKN